MLQLRTVVSRNSGQFTECHENTIIKNAKIGQKCHNMSVSFEMKVGPLPQSMVVFGVTDSLHQFCHLLRRRREFAFFTKQAELLDLHVPSARV